MDRGYFKMKRDMTRGNVTTALLWFILPLTAGNILQQLYNIVDTFIVGHYLGSNALASVGAVSYIILLFNAVMIGLKAGISVIASGDFGRKDYGAYEETRKAARVLIAAGIILTLLIGLAGGGLIMKLIQVPEEIRDSSLLYFRIIVLGYPFLFLFNYGNALMQSIGNSNIVFAALASSTGVNVVLDVVFVRYLGLGVAGAALATLAAQAVLAVVILVRLRTSRMMRELQNLRTSVRSENRERSLNHSMGWQNTGSGNRFWKKVREILQVSIPSMLQQGILAIGVVSITALINKCGTEMIAGVAISGKIEGIVSMPVVTIGEALAVFTAQNLGAGRSERIAEGLKSAVKVCSILAIGLTVVVVFHGRYLISLFLDAYDPLIIEKGYRYMMSIMIMIFFMIPFRCLIGVLTGMKNMTVVLISFGLNIMGRVTSAYILYPFAKEFAVYFANPFSVLVGSLTVFYFYMRMAKRYHRIIRENVIV